VCRMTNTVHVVPQMVRVLHLSSQTVFSVGNGLLTRRVIRHHVHHLGQRHRTHQRLQISPQHHLGDGFLGLISQVLTLVCKTFQHSLTCEHLHLLTNLLHPRGCLHQDVAMQG